MCWFKDLDGLMCWRTSVIVNLLSASYFVTSYLDYLRQNTPFENCSEKRLELFRENKEKGADHVEMR